VFVLHGRPLRPGVLLDQTPRLRDDVWPLRAAVFQQHASSWILNFLAIPEFYREVTKEIAYAMLSGTLPAGESRRAISTIRSTFSEFKRLFTWLHDRAMTAGQRPPTLTDLTAADLMDYRRHTDRVVPHHERRRFARSTVRYFWRYRTVLASDRLTFDPAHLDFWGEPHPQRSHENTTDRIPEGVLGPLLGWSLRFINDFAPDILAVNQHWLARREHPRPDKLPSHEANTALRQLLDDHLAHQRPLPGYRGRVNMLVLAEHLGCHRRLLYKRKDEIDEVAAVVGIASSSYFPLPVTGQLDGRSWIDGIATDHRHPHSLATLARMLQAAAYVVIAFLSGMRDSEVKHLQPQCLEIERDTGRSPFRWKLTSLAFKGERDPQGVKATWVVGQPVAQAIDILQQLQPPGTSMLFAQLQHGPGSGPASRSASTVILSRTTNIQLNEFARWINNYCHQRNRQDLIPLVNGQPFRLTTRQFRRSLAWFIARQPGGAIAGAIQYRHLSVQMFEGYAGTSESGFRAEVESEQALARGEHLLAMIDVHEHHCLAGPAANEAATRLERFGEQAHYQGMVITDRHRLLRLMRRDDPAIYPGRYATCVHKHETALCQQHRDSQGKPRPNLGDCQPLACRNVALSTANLDALHEEITNLDQRLSTPPPLPPLLHRQLQRRRDDIAAFIDRHTPRHNL
jgi:AraC-like DNA-binding protein